MVGQHVVQNASFLVHAGPQGRRRRDLVERKRARRWVSHKPCDRQSVCEPSCHRQLPEQVANHRAPLFHVAITHSLLCVSLYVVSRVSLNIIRLISHAESYLLLGLLCQSFWSVGAFLQVLWDKVFLSPFLQAEKYEVCICFILFQSCIIHCSAGALALSGPEIHFRFSL